MAHMRQICEVVLPLVDKDNEPLLDDRDEQMTERRKFYLLHWGLSLTSWYDNDGHFQAVNFTVGICEDMETGSVFTFVPERIKILGTETRK